MHTTSDHGLRIYLDDVVSIEVRDTWLSDDGDHATRAIRFVSNEGEILEIFCVARDSGSLRLQELEMLPLLDKESIRRRSWRLPKLYKSKK